MKNVLLAGSLLLLSGLPLGAEPGYAEANVNLRDEPGTGGRVLASIPALADMDIGDCADRGNDDWWCSVTWNGIQGYADFDFVITYDEMCFMESDDDADYEACMRGD